MDVSPQPDFARFADAFRAAYGDPYRLIVERNAAVIRTRKPGLAAANLAAIVEATLRISARTGFHSMTLRDLCREAGLSMGAVYAHIDGKDRLAAMILEHVAFLVERVVGAPDAGCETGAERLCRVLRTHVYLTEIMQPWFFFAFVEAKALGAEGRRTAIRSELFSEGIVADCIAAGCREGSYRVEDPVMAAALVKPLLQDWYLKRWKHVRRGVGPDAYAAWVIRVAEGFLVPR